MKKITFIVLMSINVFAEEGQDRQPAEVNTPSVTQPDFTPNTDVDVDVNCDQPVNLSTENQIPGGATGNAESGTTPTNSGTGIGF